MYSCKRCGRTPEHFVSESTGHVVLCGCGVKVQGFKCKEDAIDEWNFWHSDMELFKE